MELEHAFAFDIEEARTRVGALADYLQNRHGMTVTRTGPDSLTVRGRYAVVTIDATVSIEKARVTVVGRDPGMLWRMPAKKYIGGKLARYLDPTEAADSLPRK